MKCVAFVASLTIGGMRHRSSRRQPLKPKVVTGKTRQRVTSRKPKIIGASLVIVAGVILATISRQRRSRSEKHKWAPVFRVEEVTSRPHSEDAFTQGLVWAQDSLWESTGLIGMSRVRKLGGEIEEVVTETFNARHEFGEGLARFDVKGEKLIQLTWRDEVAHIWETKNEVRPRLISSFHLPGERWGIAADDDATVWYVSDGSQFISVLRRSSDGNALEPNPIRVLKVTDGGRPVYLLNELEIVRGELWANIWMSNLIARIHTRTGRVLGWINCNSLKPYRYSSPGHQVDVLNGIAYDRERNKLYVTGKLWPKIFQIKPDLSRPSASSIMSFDPFFLDKEKVDQIMASTM